MKNNLLTVMVLLLLASACNEKNRPVHLKGTLNNFESEEVEMRIETPEGYILRETIKIKLNDQNQFDMMFDINEPAYFRLGRNTLYLSPGDNIEMLVDLNDPVKANFTGTGAEANMYLRTKPFPKGGSYINDVELKKNPNFDEVLNKLNDIVATNEDRLKELTTVSERFRKLEAGRIQFDAANSLLSYPFYASYYLRLNDQQTKSFKDSVDMYFQTYISKYIKDGGDGEYLNIDTYRDICDYCVEKLDPEKVSLEIKEFIKTNELCRELASKGPVKAVLNKRTETQEKVKLENYKSIINKAFQKYETLKPGMSAPDLVLNTVDGNKVSLSEFKGQTVVIDVWATWCGPCKTEAPFFEELAKQYQTQGVKFISISIDSNKKAWSQYLEQHSKVSQQFICNRANFSAFELYAVPRFMVIDKDGKFVDAFAPAPSDPEFEEIIQKSVAG